MVVQHNMQAMNANRMLGITTGQASKSTEKLSSGYGINRAADNAAGLAISEKMRTQIRGLTQASTNAEDGISCVQTAEGALAEVQDMLQRLNELCVQAANGTNSKTDRQYIQDEIDQLVTEIDRIAETTKFNETYMLKGDDTKATRNAYITNYSMTWTRNLATNDIKNPVTYNMNYVGTNNVYIVSADIYNAKNSSMGFTGFKIQNGDDITPYLEQDTSAGTNGANGAGNHYGVKFNTTSYVAFVNVELNSAIQKGQGGNVNSASTGAYTVNASTADLSTDGNSSIVRANRELFVYNTKNGNVIKVTQGEEMEDYLDKDIAGHVKMKDQYRLVDVLYGDTRAESVKDMGDHTNTSNRVYEKMLGNNEFVWEDKYLEHDVSMNQLYDADGQLVSGVALNKYFDKNGNYTGGLFTTSQARPIDEVFSTSTAATKVLSGMGDIGVNGGVTIGKYITQSSTQVKGALDVNLHVGADSDRANRISMTIETLTAAGLGIDKLSLSHGGIGIVDSTGENATDAIDVVGEALQIVSRQRSILGAIQNRLEHTIKNLDNVVENTTQAESTIRDTDMAEEMVQYSNQNILMQAGQSMLAQANQANQGVLSLLQ